MNLKFAKALSHPQRAKILYRLADGKATTQRIAADLDLCFCAVAYHLNALVKTDCVRVAEKLGKRASIEAVYEVTPIAESGQLARIQVPPLARPHASAGVLRKIVDTGVDAIQEGTFDAREDSHASCRPVLVDEQGWRELVEIIDDTVERVTALERETAVRLAAKNNGGTVAAILAMACFESAARQRR